MAPKNKKTIKNGFYYFMLEVREREEAKGRKFSGLKEVADFVNPLWEKMLADEKEPYMKRASEAKGAASVDGRNKFTSLGVSYATIDAEAREQEEAYNIMVQTIKHSVRPLDRKGLLEQKFYLCHVNYFYKGENDFYCAGEIALSEFNLRDGILNTLHYFVDPGKIPLGLRFEAKDWAEKSHGIPFDFELGEKDYYKIYTQVRSFLTKDNKNGAPLNIPPVYTMPDSLNNNNCQSAVRCALATLCEAASENPSQFRVYSLPLLFYEIRNKCVEGCPELLIPSVAIVDSEIEKDVFSYAKNLGCGFHEEKDLSFHCSLSIVKRWVYTLCDHCCKHVGVSLELGKHCPKDADVNWDYKYSRSNTRFKENPEDVKPNDNSFTPTIVDHGALREQREQQYLEETENLRKAQQIRPPHSLNPRASVRPTTMTGLKTGMGVWKNEEDETPWPISGRGRLLPKY